MTDRKILENIFSEHQFTDFKWITGEDIITAQWVRMKCTYGCTSYGQKGTCPPQVPTIEECRKFFNEYSEIAIFHFSQFFANPDDRFSWSKQTNNRLLKLEREVFIRGFQKTFLLFMDECCLCQECPGTRKTCKNKTAARPSPESLSVDVFSTVRKSGYTIQVLKDYKQTMNRFSFLLIN